MPIGRYLKDKNQNNNNNNNNIAEEAENTRKQTWDEIIRIYVSTHSHSLYMTYKSYNIKMDNIKMYTKAFKRFFPLF